MANKIPCPDCGGAPTPHRFTWFNESFFIVFSPFQRWLSRRKSYRLLDRGVDFLLLLLTKLFSTLGILTFSADKSNFTIQRGLALWSEAERRGYRMAYARILGKRLDFYRVTMPHRTIYFTGLPRPDQGNPALAWLDDKYILKTKLRAANLPAPNGASVSSLEQGADVFNRLQKPVIVKPRLGSRGRHTTTNIHTAEDFARAFASAKQLCHWVIVEEQLAGDVYRGTVIGGRLVGVLAGSAPSVTGDGKKTIAELIAQKNETRDPRVAAVKISSALVLFIGRQGYGLDSVIPAGTTISLDTHVGVNYGGTSSEITGIMHPKIADALEAAGRVVNDAIIGFDFIVQDPAQDPENQQWGIIEANGLPFIQLHANPLYGEPNNIAAHIWDLFDPQ